MAYAVTFGIGVGLAGGALLGYLAARSMCRALVRKFEHRRMVIALVSCGFIVALPTTLFVAFVVGGNLGGGAGAFASEWVGLGSAGVPLGLALGIALFLAVGLSAGSALGAVLAYIAVILMRGKLAT